MTEKWFFSYEGSPPRTCTGLPPSCAAVSFGHTSFCLHVNIYMSPEIFRNITWRVLRALYSGDGSLSLTWRPAHSSRGSYYLLSCPFGPSQAHPLSLWTSPTSLIFCPPSSPPLTPNYPFAWLREVSLF